MTRHLRPAALALALACTAASAQTLPDDFDPDVARANCEADWQEDFSMVRYCLRQQTAAAESVARKLPGLDDTMRGRYAACARSWGADFTMRDYCLDNQIAARAALPATLSRVPETIAASIETTCRGQWGDDFEMLDYCARQLATDWQALND